MKKIYLVDYSKCAYNSCGRPCITYCPVTLTNKKLKGKKKVYPAIDFKKSTSQIIIHSEICLKCGICINKCPSNAIFVKNLVEEDESQQKIHQYAEDSFRLYNLPTLMSGRVTGLCGPNGIGKSTMLNILSMIMKPNFGEFDVDLKKNNWKNIATQIRDSNIRNHFIDNEINRTNISYKLQVLKVLFEKYKDLTVSDILESSSIDKKFKNMVFSSLDIQTIENRYLEQCSGGELQRFAIAQVLLSNSDILLIDEPVTFLDVKKRIRLAEMLQKAAKEYDKAVLVVDHDLTVLDYMSDVIHLFYGEPHKFGIITRVQPVKAGINSYLNGYQKNENVEFRPNKIRFRKSISGRTWSNAQKFAEWDEITKDLGEFKLKINPGIIYQNEILGVVGENGLGKTTWFRILIGNLKPDSGNMNLTEQFAISYKPQYITQNYNGTVEQLITEYSQKYIQTEELLTKIYEPLGVDDIFDAKVPTLSGGQLQRTFIAACLSKEANLYLIDEPSAYLDVEERLKIAEIIRSHTKSKSASAICIEHDIQITDSLADRLLIFLGDPGKSGYTLGPLNKRDGMNAFLKTLDVTFRRDLETGRARINKKDSSLDQRQRASGEYYYDKIQEYSKFLEED
ncbi:MAG: ribosome biogenesis/translation initiation ATPase RLI [archaeon]|nr:ribosome biogenesis/translation initiation ATPase RLI [archaeon]